MITAETLTKLITFSAKDLQSMLCHKVLNDCIFTDAKFLGITNGGQYCYQVAYDDQDGSYFGKVFVTYDQLMNKMTADF